MRYCSLPRAALPRAVAPPGSDKTAQLIAAGSRRDASGELYYTQEFTVQSPRFFRHNLAGEAAQEGSSAGWRLLAFAAAYMAAACTAWPVPAAAAGTAASALNPRSAMPAALPCTALPRLQCMPRATACSTPSTASAPRSGGPTTPPPSAQPQPPLPSSTLELPPRASLASSKDPAAGCDGSKWRMRCQHAAGTGN